MTSFFWDETSSRGSGRRTTIPLFRSQGHLRGSHFELRSNHIYHIVASPRVPADPFASRLNSSFLDCSEPTQHVDSLTRAIPPGLLLSRSSLRVQPCEKYSRPFSPYFKPRFAVLASPRLSAFFESPRAFPPCLVLLHAPLCPSHWFRCRLPWVFTSRLPILVFYPRLPRHTGLS